MRAGASHVEGDMPVERPLAGLVPFQLNGHRVYLRRPTRKDVADWKAFRAQRATGPVGDAETSCWAVSRFVTDDRGGRLFASVGEVMRALDADTVMTLIDRITRLETAGF